MPSGDLKGAPVDETIGQLVACAFVNFGDCRAGNAHLLGALCVGSLFQIDSGMIHIRPA